jgi:dienelactone hydrolase
VDGKFYAPADGKRHPAVILIGGSEGGIPKHNVAKLTGEGYAVLALAYFGVDGLPKHLVSIPVETVSHGLDWLAARPEVDPHRIAVIGSSRGSELALLAAANDPRIRAVIVISPSAYVWDGLDPDAKDDAPVPAWTLNGKAWPTVPFTKADDDKAKTVAGVTIERPTFESALSHATPSQRSAAAIPVERIAGPILCIAGQNDELWDGPGGCRAIAARRGHSAAGRDVYVIEAGAGHVIRFDGTVVSQYSAGGQTLGLGGTQSANEQAAADAWARAKLFLSSVFSREPS